LQQIPSSGEAIELMKIVVPLFVSLVVDGGIDVRHIVDNDVNDLVEKRSKPKDKE